MNDITTKELDEERRWWAEFHKRRKMAYFGGSLDLRKTMADEMEKLGMTWSAECMRVNCTRRMNAVVTTGSGRREQ